MIKKIVHLFFMMFGSFVSSQLLANDLIISNSVSVVSGITSGQLIRPTKEAGIEDRVYSYSGGAFGASTQGYISQKLSWSASMTALIAMDINKVIKREIDIGFGYGILGGPSNTTVAKGDILINAHYGSATSIIIKVGTSDFAISSDSNQFDDTSGSVVNFFIGGRWEWYFTSRMGFGAEFLATVYSFSSSTDNLTTQENRILFFASLL